MTAKEKRVWAQYLREVSEALDRWADEPISDLAELADKLEEEAEDE